VPRKAAVVTVAFYPTSMSFTHSQAQALIGKTVMTTAVIRTTAQVEQRGKPGSDPVFVVIPRGIEGTVSDAVEGSRMFPDGTHYSEWLVAVRFPVASGITAIDWFGEGKYRESLQEL
jgi:hypothetical protein